MAEHCAICGCRVHRIGNTYAQASIVGRSHVSKHYYVAERFFGRAKNRRGMSLEGIFPFCPWKREAQFGVLCYECHTELLFHPVLLPEDVTHFAELVKRRGLSEVVKTESRAPIAGRVALLQEVIALGIAAALRREQLRARRRALRDLAPFLSGFIAIFLLVGFSPWVSAYSASESIAVEGWVVFLAGLFICALTPARPFRAALLGSVGIFVGTGAGIIAHVIVSNAVGVDPHQAFVPSAIASHAGMSAPGLLLSALIWKAASASFYWDLARLRDLAQTKIQAQRQKLIATLGADIAALRSGSANIAAAQATQEQEVLRICSNALYGLAEFVLTQYDGVVAEQLVPNWFALRELSQDVPSQLQPLFDECLAQVRREANRGGVPEATAKSVTTLESRYRAICNDIALTLRASLTQRYRDLLQELATLLFERFPKLVWDTRRWAVFAPLADIRLGLAAYWRKSQSRRRERAPAIAD